MLVPNPSEVAKAQIGNRDFDLVRLEDMFRALTTFALQVSELSERQSVGSFEISSSSEDDLEEDEQDQEYQDSVLLSTNKEVLRIYVEKADGEA